VENDLFDLDINSFESTAADQLDPLDNDLKVATPENIAFQYRVAGPFRRLGAYLFDIIVIMGAYLVFTGIIAGILQLILSLIGSALNIQSITEALGGLVSMIWMIGWFIVLSFYGAIAETYQNGQTVGKRIFALRVLTVDGRAINGMQSGLRNLIRFADIFPLVTFSSLTGMLPEFAVAFIPTGVVAMLFMMFSRRYQRLGDLIANTVVVLEEKKWNEGVTMIDDVRVRQLAGYIPQNFVASKDLAQALAGYVDRRSDLTLPRLMEISRHLAEPLLEKFNFDPTVNHDLLLCALYYRSFNELDEQDSYIPPGIVAPQPLPPQNPYHIIR
jgi:uncharacterized RDD family membrane protein YckC